MRKISALLCILLASAGIGLASDYPPELQGGQFVGEMAVDSYLYDAWWTPYSFPFDNDVFYQGIVNGSPGSVEITLSCLARHPLGECMSPAPWQYRGGKAFQWNADAGCYMDEWLRDDGFVGFEAWVLIDTSTWVWVEGCLEVVPGHPLPDFVWSQACAAYFFMGTPGTMAAKPKSGGVNASD